MSVQSTPRKTLHAALRDRYISKIIELLTADGEEVLRTKTNEIAIPCVDSEGNDEWITISTKVPLGSRDGEAYDGYGEAETYRLHVKEVTEREARTAEKKREKVKRDTARREALAKAKAEHEKEIQT